MLTGERPSNRDQLPGAQLIDPTRKTASFPSPWLDADSMRNLVNLRCTFAANTNEEPDTAPERVCNIVGDGAKGSDPHRASPNARPSDGIRGPDHHNRQVALAGRAGAGPTLVRPEQALGIGAYRNCVGRWFESNAQASQASARLTHIEPPSGMRSSLKSYVALCSMQDPASPPAESDLPSPLPIRK